MVLGDVMILVTPLLQVRISKDPTVPVACGTVTGVQPPDWLCQSDGKITKDVFTSRKVDGTLQ